MQEEELPEIGALSLFLGSMRRRKRMTQEKAAEEFGVSVGMVKYYETEAEPPYDLLVAWGGHLGRTPEEVAAGAFGMNKAFGPVPETGSPVDPTPAETRLIRGIAGRIGRAADALIERFLVPATRTWRVRRARREAGKLWRELERTPEEFRRDLLDVSPRFHTWAVAERLALESERAASDRADRALALAELGCRAAKLCTGVAAFLAGIRGFALFLLANARRVANQLQRAGEDFDRALAEWEKASPEVRQLLGAWHVKDLECSLRRDQRRFPEALKSNQEARDLAPLEEVPCILVNRAVVFEHMGANEQAVAVLREAQALGGCDAELAWAIEFNLAANLAQLENYSEAAAALPKLQLLAATMRKALHQVRLGWLTARCEAGLGQVVRARAGFEQARLYFHEKTMPADYALVSLERAVLDLAAGRRAEVRVLAEELSWLFAQQGLAPEALAALAVFRAAVAQEKATADLARRLVRYLYRAQFDPRLRFEAEEAGRQETADPGKGGVR